MCVFKKAGSGIWDPVFKILICRIRIRPKIYRIRNPASVFIRLLTGKRFQSFTPRVHQ